MNGYFIISIFTFFVVKITVHVKKKKICGGKKKHELETCKTYLLRVIYPVQIGTLERCTLEICLCLIFLADSYERLLSEYKYPDDRCT